MYDIIILGSGPAGLTAALYAARANKKTLVLGGDQLGGQLNVIPKLENYPGFTGSGRDLGEFMKKQAESFGAEVIMASAKRVTRDSLIANRQTDTTHDSRFTILADDGTEYESKAVIVATGAKPKKLNNLIGVREFMGRGISYCATCDGFFFTDKDVLVVGGGNSAFNDALYLADLAKSVRIVYRKDSFARAEQVLVDRAMARDNISAVFNTEIAEVGGGAEGMEYAITTKGEKLIADGIFIAIGVEANTDFLSEEYKRDAEGRVIASSLPAGLYVAGDVRADGKMQVATAVGFGCEAAILAIEYVNEKKIVGPLK